MRRHTKTLLLLTAAGAPVLPGLLVPGLARAQTDLFPPMPNVLLMIDTSGSMERMPNGDMPTDFDHDGNGATATINACNAADYSPNRWSLVVQALTGDLQVPSCIPLPRDDSTSPSFSSIYSFGGQTPYDTNYYLPFHRLASNGCTTAPGNAGAQFWEFPSDAIAFQDAAGAACTNFNQSRNGVMDEFGNRVRFGVMMFDTLSSPETGYDFSTNYQAPEGFEGMWSYWYRSAGQNYQTGANPYSGFPPGCGGIVTEVGARSPTAPPWEGRLMGFGRYDMTWADAQVRNRRAQQVVSAARPFGATPLAGMFNDALELITLDDLTEPVIPAPAIPDPYGPLGDPYWDFTPGVMDPPAAPTASGQCRKTAIILITDGEPNLDLRPDCDLVGGSCPYEKPDDIAADLYASPYFVETYVIGIGLESVYAASMSPPQTVDCTLLDASSNDVGGICDATPDADPNTRPPELEACCTLVDIAEKGGTNQPYFPSTLSSFRTVLTAVLEGIGGGTTSRTFPVFALAASDESQGNADVAGIPPAGYQFVSSVNTHLSYDLWSGNLERKRYACEGSPPSPEIQDIDDAVGDDYGQNLAANIGARTYFTVNPDLDGGVAQSNRSIRPNLSADDGVGLWGGSQAPAVTTGPATLASFIAAVAPESLGVAPSYPSTCDDPMDSGGSAALCSAKALTYISGSSIASSWSPSGNYQRSAPLGGILHSTPTIATPPREFLRDELYSAYADAQRSAPTMLYTATTDGWLHAFRVAKNTGLDYGFADSNRDDPPDGSVLAELWAFAPPIVLPHFVSSFASNAVLLDGQPVVRDVVFERDFDAARDASLGVSYATGVNYDGEYRRVLVAGGGQSTAGGFYYALDITNLEEPEFLWQLSSTTADEPLFGDRVPTPAVTTVAVGIGAARTEIAVAVLPGGSGDPLPGVEDRQGAPGPGIPYTPRAKVRAWNDAITNSGRTLTIVRVDNGEVLMHFRASTSEGVDLSATNRSKEVLFDSPLTGTPVPFPGRTGEVASRIYIGDEDGTLWRINVADPDPANWDVEIAFDSFYDVQAGPPGYISTVDEAGAAGQPIQTPPVISVDDLGDPVILWSTGDQEQATYTQNMVNRAFSITDRPDGSGGYTVIPNWGVLFEHGHRVVGPLAVFDRTVYFSAFRPNRASCIIGNAEIWGLDFIQNEGDIDDPTPRFDDGGTIVDKIDLDPGTIVYGLGVTQVPSCSTSTDISDPYLAQQYQSLSDVNVGEFQLVFHTGKGGTADTENAAINTQTLSLPPPRSNSRVTSWASIVE